MGRATMAEIALKVLPAVVVEQRDYTQTAAGVQAILAHWDQQHAGRYGLMVIDLSGRNLGAAHNGSMDFVTASTFKAFLAYAVLYDVERGRIGLDTRTDMGLSVRACIDEMIIRSTNECASSLQRLIGVRHAHDVVRATFPSTILDNSLSGDGDKHTTPADLGQFFVRLQAGQLLDSGHTDYLLGLFKSQRYRSGIPAGVPGVTVADKVGFYNGYIHDAGIVYAPGGAYVLVAMSQGGVMTSYADLSARVYALIGR
jgi:beta-lactamase class A